MISDPIGDMLIRIKNGYMAGNKSVIIPFSKFKMELAKLLVGKGYLESYAEEEKERTFKVILKYINKIPALTEVKRVSKPGLRVYKGKNKMPRALSGLGLVVVSTPHGLISAKDAKRQGVGGEVICKIW